LLTTKRLARQSRNQSRNQPLTTKITKQENHIKSGSLFKTFSFFVSFMHFVVNIFDRVWLDSERSLL
jgi:hypothetical protein